MPTWLIPFLELVGTILYYLAAFCVALIALLVVAFVILVVFGYLKIAIIYFLELRFPPATRELRRDQREILRREARVLRGMLSM